MKKSILILLFGMLFISTAHSQRYFGKTYAPTQTVDEYYAVADITKEYTIMGKTELDKGFRSLEKTQKKNHRTGKKEGC